ncbi:hypothetical protein FB45DRAFT_1066742 [Roridomyces roridus]|uniref:Uncharacterized protein n=1 Tax=Roridomyces roridus TaxID=1738132 RepID=A0AAD7FAY1_9AGAR|nr:hypothetical protein FB45DRAFT_1066742 [Roridomyces roridus]
MLVCEALSNEPCPSLYLRLFNRGRAEYPFRLHNTFYVYIYHLGLGHLDPLGRVARWVKQELQGLIYATVKHTMAVVESIRHLRVREPDNTPLPRPFHQLKRYLKGGDSKRPACMASDPEPTATPCSHGS